MAAPRYSDALALLLAGLAVVLAVGWAVPEFSHGAPCLWDIFNDQFNYLSAARNLAEEGALRSNVIYPSLLRDEHALAFLYAPGTPAVLAAAHLLLGAGLLAAVVPGVLAYLVGALSTWYAAYRLSGRLPALWAGLAYLLFPAHAAFLHTAMTEQLLGAACALSLALALTSRRTAAFWLAAVAATLAVLLRETAMAYFVVLAGLALGLRVSEGRNVAWPALALGFMLSTLLTVTLIAGRPSLFLANLMVDNADAVYRDAFALDGIAVNAGSLIAALGQRFLRNVNLLMAGNMLNPEEYFVLGIMLLGIFVCLVRGLLRREPFCLAVSVAGLFTLALLMTTYKIEFFKGTRVLAFLWPALCVALADGWKRLQSPAAVAAGLLILACGVATHSLVTKRASVCSVWFAESRAEEQFLDQHVEGLGPVLVGHGLFGMSWVLEQPGAAWAFLPSNQETFDLLDDAAGVDYVALAARDRDSAIADGLRQDGFVERGVYRSSSVQLLLLSRRDEATHSDE